MTKTQHIVFCLWCCCALYAHAQLPHIQTITVADGLSQGFITTMLQDSRGFMWFGTLDGLNRYDGYSIWRYNYRPFDPYSLTGSAYITQITESRDGLLWIGTDEVLYIFDPATERFFNINQQVKNLPRAAIVQIAMDDVGNLIVHMPNQDDPLGLYRIQVPAGMDRQLRFGAEPLAGMTAEHLTLPPDATLPVVLDDCIRDTILLVRDQNGKGYKFVPGTSGFVAVDLMQWNVAEETILWGKNYGVFFRYKRPDGQYAPLVPNRLRRLIRLKDGSAITTSGVGNTLYAFSPKQVLQSPEPILPNGPKRKDFLPWMELPHSISVILQDRSDVIWAGTGGHGLCKVNLRNLAFHHYLPGASVYNFREMPDGRIWMGKFFPNHLFNIRSGQLEPAPWAAYFKTEYPYNVLTDRAGNTWFTSCGKLNAEVGSILFREKTTGKMHRIARLPIFRELVVEQIMEDRHSNIWVAAHNGYLFRCQAKDFKVERFDYTHVFPENYLNLTANAILEDSEDDQIWIGTSGGLVKASIPKKGEAPVFRLLEYRSDKSTVLNWNSILCLYQNPQEPHLIWLGTRGGGLNCYDKNTGFFRVYTTENGLADNVVYGIVPDSEGHLWCSTNRGISRFQPGKEVFVNYYASDGLQDNEFNTGAFLKNHEGKLLFGGVNGLTVFDPAQIQINQTPPPVAITMVKVRGNPLLPARADSPLQFAPYFKQELRLPFYENNVTFEFAALDFANPATNRYRYLMKGIDRDWIYSGTTHFANYASLPPGRYEFQVQGATADGEWNPESALFQLCISPPWYRSSMAYVLYFLLVIAGIWGFIKLREQRLREYHLLQLKNRESERLQELDMFKNRLFANISHEFRTPLTLILGLAERLKKGEPAEEAVQSAARIINQGNNLLELVNQVLDLAKLESQDLTLQPVQGDLCSFFRFHASSFQSLAASNNIHLQIKTAPSVLVMDFDPQRFRQILNNLLSNALRHTPSSGNIVASLIQQDEGHVELKVTDSGEGISPEDMPYIFDRFYQGRSSTHPQRTGGIGLALTRELVLLAGGEIHVSSTLGQGSVFRVVLPITNTSEGLTAGLAVSATGDAPTVYSINTASPDAPLLLIVEDNPDVSDFLKSCLCKHYQLLFAANGEEGIRMAFEHIPDIILSDVMMPGKNGYEVIQTLKNDPRTSHVPIVLLTARAQSEDRLSGLRYGAIAYLTKPFLEEELLLVLRNQINNQQVWKKRYSSFVQENPRAYETAAETNESAFKKEDEFMEKLYLIFEENYADEHFHLEQLCRLAGMSSSQLHRKLAALTDQSAMQLLRNFRLHKARELLLQRPGIQVSEVALLAGFNNAAHFSRLFSKTYGMPPSAVKK